MKGEKNDLVLKIYKSRSTFIVKPMVREGVTETMKTTKGYFRIITESTGPPGYKIRGQR